MSRSSGTPALRARRAALAVATTVAMTAHLNGFAQGPAHLASQAAPVTALPGGESVVMALDSDQAVRLAIARSQRVVANEAVIDASRARAIAAGKRPDPMFTTGLQGVPLNGPDRGKLHNDSFTMTAFGIKQELTSRDKLAARSERYEREAESGAAARTLSIVEIARDTRLAWLALSFLDSADVLLEEVEREVGHHLEAVDAAYRGGRGTQGESVALRIELERIADRRRENARDHAVAQARLERWVGAAASLPLAPRAPLASESAATAIEPDLLRSVDAHPALARLRAQQASARAEVEVARTERSADWSVELAVGIRRPTFSNLGTVNFSIPITWNRADRQDREVAARLSEADAAAAEVEEARRIAVSDLRQAREGWQHEQDRLTRYDEAFIPLAAQRSSAALAAWRGGAGTLGAVLEAHHAEIETRLDQLKLERELAEMSVQLDYWLSANKREAATGLRQGNDR